MERHLNVLLPLFGVAFAGLMTYAVVLQGQIWHLF